MAYAVELLVFLLNKFLQLYSLCIISLCKTEEDLANGHSSSCMQASYDQLNLSTYIF